MRRIVEKGKTLLVEGPASIVLLTGKVRVLGGALEIGEKTIIREGKRVPFAVIRRATFDLTLSENSSTEEVDGSTIPPSWDKVCKKIMAHKKPVTVTVIGEVDSGKTSFCVYLANKALEKMWRVAVIDADLGQSDIGPPSTISFSHVTKPVKDLFEIFAEDAYFIGLTSPSRAISSVIKGLTTLRSRERGGDLLIINTDGWVEGDDAVHYKIQLVEKVAPDIVVGIQQEIELASILTALEGKKIFVIESSLWVQRRNREKRKKIRELGYKKYLKEAKVHSFFLSRIKLERFFIGTGKPFTSERLGKIEKFLRGNPVYSEETPTAILIVLREGQWVREEKMKKLEEVLAKRVKVIRNGEEEGLILAMKNAQGCFLGLGVLSGINYKRRVIKVYTPVSENVATISVGQIKLDNKGREIGLAPFIEDFNP